MIRSRILRIVAAGGVAVGVLALATPAGADLNPTKDGNQIVACANGVTIGTFNPTIKASSAKYIKAAFKSSDGTKTAFLSGAPVPDDGLVCLVDAGIRTDQPTQDPKYVLDNQDNGNPALTVTGASLTIEGSQSMVMTGSSSCDFINVDANTAGYTYPSAYPMQGKATWKFEQTFATGVQIQLQQYLRFDYEAAEANPSLVSIAGIVIKGPGLGGTTSAYVDLYPTSSVKNIAVADCVLGNPASAVAEVSMQNADGLDADLLVDTWDVSIPS